MAGSAVLMQRMPGNIECVFGSRLASPNRCRSTEKCRRKLWCESLVAREEDDEQPHKRSAALSIEAFRLPSVDEILPPGTYLIETEEEQIASLSLVAYRRVATTIAAPALGTETRSKQVITIDPSEWAAARTKDSEN
jgi:hypothetical protein